MIDITTRRPSADQQYGVYALYISKTETWDIPNQIIPDTPQRIMEWEDAGQGIHPFLHWWDIAMRIARLVTDCMQHRRFSNRYGI